MFKPLLSIIVILFSIGLGFFYVKPEYSHVKETQTDLADLSETLKEAGAIPELIAKTSEGMKDVKESDLEKFDTFLPKTIDHIRLANNIQYIGLEIGIIVTDLKVSDKAEKPKVELPQKQTSTVTSGIVDTFALKADLPEMSSEQASVEEQSDRYKATKVNFSFITTYSGLKDLLDKVEKSLGVMNITTLTFSEVKVEEKIKATSIQSAPLYQFVVEIETYSLQ